ncbi:MAG: prolipoprotein diacylglyceryl transferase [Anaerolineae bacterium]|nr:prolipoprotein diacylglyceryl transferase [Anaerolineae bacterium]
MHPTLFTIGNWSVPTYTVLLDLGLILGLVLAYFEGRRLLQSGETGLDLGLWAIIGGVIGGRAAYVIANLSAFQEEPIRAIRLWEGGLSFHGGVLGGLLVLLLFALFRDRGLPSGRNSFWRLADVLTPGVAVGIAFGWAACLMGGCAYGALGEGFGYAVLPDLFGVAAPRFATQAVALGFSLLLAAGIWLLRGHWPFPGASFLLYGLLYFAGQFFLEFTRGDEAIYLGSLRLAQIIDLALVLAAALGLLLLWWRGEEEPAGEEARPSDEQEALPADVEEAPPPDEEEAPPPDEEEVLPPDEEVALAAGDDEPEAGEEG